MARKYGQKVIIKALKEANGILALAADNLGCSRTTIYNAIQKWPKVEAAYNEANEKNIDVVESKLMKLIDKLNVPAIIFFLKTKGRGRGYTEHLQIAPVDPTGTKEYGADTRNALLSKLIPGLALEDEEGEAGEADG